LQPGMAAGWVWPPPATDGLQLIKRERGSRLDDTHIVARLAPDLLLIPLEVDRKTTRY
jgi:hypothetical protein